jgi:alkylated DNA repair protein alkB homolog 1
MYKKYQRMDDAAVDEDLYVVDFNRGLTEAQKDRIVAVDTVPSDLIDSARKVFENYDRISNVHSPNSETMPSPCTVYEHNDFDGRSQHHPILSYF